MHESSKLSHEKEKLNPSQTALAWSSLTMCISIWSLNCQRRISFETLAFLFIWPPDRPKALPCSSVMKVFWQTLSRDQKGCPPCVRSSSVLQGKGDVSSCIFADDNILPNFSYFIMSSNLFSCDQTWLLDSFSSRQTYWNKFFSLTICCLKDFLV